MSVRNSEGYHGILNKKVRNQTKWSWWTSCKLFVLGRNASDDQIVVRIHRHCVQFIVLAASILHSPCLSVHGAYF